MCICMIYIYIYMYICIYIYICIHVLDAQKGAEAPHIARLRSQSPWNLASEVGIHAPGILDPKAKAPGSPGTWPWSLASKSPDF